MLILNNIFADSSDTNVAYLYVVLNQKITDMERGCREIRHRATYPSAKQKRKLMSMVAQHPQLISYKPSPNFGPRDCENLWVKIATECNSYPGARKTWRQWRKTWQDIKTKHKKSQIVPPIVRNLTDSEREALGWKNVTSTTTHPELEFYSPDDEISNDNNDSIDDITLNNDVLNDDSLNANDELTISEPESPPEVKIERSPSRKGVIVDNRSTNTHNTSCAFNCDRLAAQEERKISIKEDYLNFKKDYLRQKLILMKEQVEALKGIAQNIKPEVVHNPTQ